MIEEQYLTPGVLVMISSAWRATSPVRCSEAALGSWMPAKMNPWSSSGRKPVGIALAGEPGQDRDASRRMRLVLLFRMAIPQMET